METKENGTLCAGSAVKFDTSFGHEGGADFSLPDYLPEVQRLLAVTATVLPETKFLSGSVLELGGTLSYNVLYSDAEGKAASASLVTEYSADCALPCECENVGEIFVSTEHESSACRVTSPRTLNIKTRMRSRVASDESVTTDGFYAEKDGKRAGDAETAGIERKTYSLCSALRSRGMTTGSASGEITAPDAAKVTVCYACVDCSDVSCSDGAVQVRGEIRVRCMFSAAEECVIRYARLPFENSLPMDKVNASFEARAWGRAASVSVSPVDSSENVFSVNVEYDLEAEAVCRVMSNICCDAYSTEYECVGDMRECEMICPVSFGAAKVASSADFELPQNLTGKLCDVVPVSHSLSLSQIDGKSTIAGSVKVKAVFMGEEASSAEYDVPVKYPLSCTATDAQSFINCTVLSCDGKTSGGGLTVNVETALCWNVSEKKRVGYVGTVSLGEALPRESGMTLRVFYPQRDEALWDICKKYKAGIAGVIRANPGIGETVPKGRHVMIC